MTTKLNKLIVIRDRARNSILTYEKFVDSFISKSDQVSTRPLLVRKHSLQQSFNEFKKTSDDIIALSPGAADKELFIEVEITYLNTLTKIEEYVDEHNKQLGLNETGNLSVHNETVNVTSESNVKLPNVDIPSFSGANISEFKTFYSLFEAVIDKNTNLSNVQKLFYLLKYLTGDARSLVDKIPFVDESYPQAIKLLKDRYDDDSILIATSIYDLVDLPSIGKGTAQQLRDFVKNIKQIIASLKNLKQPVDQWDTIVAYLLLRKLDSSTRRAYQLDKPQKQIPTVNEVLKFLEERAVAFEAANISERNNSEQLKTQTHNKRTSLLNVSRDNKQSKRSCKFCVNGIHKLFHCYKFKALKVNDRIQFIKNNGLCELCFQGHRIGECKFANNFKCKHCSKPHNNLLHIDIKVEGASKTESYPNSNFNDTQNDVIPSTSQSSLHNSNTSNHVLLPIVRVKVYDKNNKGKVIKALLDSGSQVSFITEEFLSELGFSPLNKEICITGINNKEVTTKKAIYITLHSLTLKYSIDICCSIIPKITNNLPAFYFNKDKVKLPEVVLSNPDFNVPDKISMLLGADVFSKICESGYLEIPGTEAKLMNTRFGFAIIGNCQVDNVVCSTAAVSLLNRNETKSLERLLSKFWEMEKVPEIFCDKTSENQMCEDIFKRYMTIKNNKFQVNLPLKQDYLNIVLGNSYTAASVRFFNLEKRFTKDQNLFLQYKQFIDEYISSGDAKIINIKEYESKMETNAYFLAHHPVIKGDKRTTKIRVVFDGGLKTTKRISLNNVLLNGPVLQKNLFEILILFRTYKYIMITDIKQMYRRVHINDEHKSLQNILWRDHPNKPLQCLQLQTVTWGLKSSSYLATRCLIELANEYKSSFPLAANALIHNTYVDDILCGSNNLVKTEQMQKELISLLKLGSFQLHKWISNDDALLQNIKPENRYFEDINFEKDPNSYIKTLGIQYSVKTDSFKMTCPLPDFDDNFPTKRKVLSFIAKIYDPLGFLGPIITTAKIIMQKIWLEKIEWDDRLPHELKEMWEEFVKSLKAMHVIEIKRSLNFHQANLIQLVGFCDASNVAYGCCVYCRIISKDYKAFTNLICSKSKVCPINERLTVPRAELNSALLLAKLISKVYSIFSSNVKEVYLFSDSNVVLSWLQTDIFKLNTYVANRVAKIVEMTSKFTWKHVESAKNPSDLISRGIMPHMLASNSLWWTGPDFLNNPDFSLLNSNFRKNNIEEPVPELKVNTAVLLTKSDLPVFTKYSSLVKLQRVISYVLRFINNVRYKQRKLSGNLLPEEMENALKLVIKIEQHNKFYNEISSLDSNKEIKSNLKYLHPFLDKENILRVSGRLQNANNIPYSQRHPIILPKGSHLTNLIILHEHILLFHAGQKHLLASLQQKYWIISAIKQIKKIVHHCLTCFKLRSKSAEQLMGSLPSDRVNFFRPFIKSGMDYFGPFYIKQSRLRNVLETKAYVCLFICFSTKAVHLELCSDLTTENFLACFKRFISRRGRPQDIYCDNMSTYKGANNELTQIFEFINSSKIKDVIENYYSSQGVKFHFIPSYSPNFGGLWEAGVKSAKHHLRRIIGDTKLTYEELNTIIVQVEGILNSRPITPVSQDIDDLSYLTPSHFLLGSNINYIPEKSIVAVPSNRLKSWRICTKIQQQFWDKWHKDYLNQLHVRFKWYKTSHNIKEGMLVLLKDENLPPLKWSLARITKIVPGKDGKVRVVEIKTKSGTYLRSISKIIVLPFDEKDCDKDDL